MVAKKKNEVAKQDENLPAYMNQGEARGQENVTVDDLSIPRLDVIQALSPQRKKKDPEYIDGAEEGMLFNSVSKKLYGEKVTFVPCFFRKEWLVWRDRDSGGGFGGAYPTQRVAAAEARERGEGWEEQETAQHFGILIDSDGNAEEVVISMSRSKMKASRQLNTLAKMAGGDRFASQYEVSAVEVSGERGDYFSLGIKRLGWVEEDVYKAGEKLYEAVSSGNKDVSRDHGDVEKEDEEDENY